MALLELPVTEKIAEILRVPCIRVEALKTMHALAGNGMHLPNVSLVIAVVLVCVKRLPHPSPSDAAAPRQNIMLKGAKMPRETPMGKLRRFTHVDEDDVRVHVPGWSVSFRFQKKYFEDSAEAETMAENILDKMRQCIRKMYDFVAHQQFN